MHDQMTRFAKLRPFVLPLVALGAGAVLTLSMPAVAQQPAAPAGAASALPQASGPSRPSLSRAAVGRSSRLR